MVAINKIDRPNSNPDRVKQELGENEVYVESYGGKVPSANISAKTGEGISDLLDLLLLVSDLENLQANKAEPASGFVLESKLDPKVGATVTLIIKDGTLRRGDFVGIAGKVAKIKKMENFLGQDMAVASFSSPVKIFGFCEVPEAGKNFVSFGDKKQADQYSTNNIEDCENQPNIISETVTDNPELVDLALVVKSDSHGTLEAVIHEINKIKDDRVRFKIIDTGVGIVTDKDLKILIGSSQPYVAGFNVKIDKSAQDLAERHGVKIKSFNIIYQLTEWLQNEIVACRPKLTEEIVVAKIKIIKIFNQVKDKQVLGGLVQQGTLKKGAIVKIWRREAEIGRGKVVELQTQKIATSEVSEENQFGAMIDSKSMISEGDKLEAIELITR